MNRESVARHSDLVIIGGGVVGLSIAWQMSKLGVRVAVLDSSEISGGASWAGAGILPPVPTRGAIDPYEQLRVLSHRLHGEWAEQLHAETGIDTEFRKCGGLYLATSPAEAATLIANEFWWEEHGIEFEKWSNEELLRQEPELAIERESPLKGIWHLPTEHQLRNPRHIQALAKACSQNSVTVCNDQKVLRLDRVGDRIEAVQTANGRWTADQFCICSGAWSRLTLEQLGVPTGIMPIRGQMILYRSGQPLIQRVINEGNRYLVPRLDGRLLVGSVEEEVGYRVETTDVAIQELRQWAEAILPSLRSATLEKSWAGLRPGSFDGFPYLGAVPGCTNLFVAAGHFRSGLHLSCATAEVMADVMRGESPQIDLQPFRVGRG